LVFRLRETVRELAMNLASILGLDWPRQCGSLKGHRPCKLTELLAAGCGADAVDGRLGFALGSIQ
jgi:hypothetical protein